MEEQSFRFQAEIETLKAYIEEAGGISEEDFEKWYLQRGKDRIRLFSDKPPTKEEFIKKTNCALLMYKKI